MKVHHQFDLNRSILRIENFNEIPILVERLIKNLIEKGYTVFESSAYQVGIPQSITVVKDFTGPFVLKFSEKIQDDFKAVSKVLGIEKLFE